MVSLEKALFLQSQPGDKIRIVFSVRQEDDVARFELQTERHKINAKARIEGENNLLFAPGIDEFHDRPARTLQPPFRIAVDTIGNLPGKPVPTPPRAAGWKFRVVFRDGLDDLAGNERVAGVIEINRRFPVVMVLERRKVTSSALQKAFAGHEHLQKLFSNPIYNACAFYVQYDACGAVEIAGLST